MRRTPHLLRPGSLPRLPKDWKERCEKIRSRDRACRFGGCPLTGVLVAVDHIIPRRAIRDLAWKDNEENLALLCARHHAGVKATVERRFFKGRADALVMYLKTIRRTGPIPSPDQLAAAYFSVRALVFPETGGAHA